MPWIPKIKPDDRILVEQEIDEPYVFKETEFALNKFETKLDKLVRRGSDNNQMHLRISAEVFRKDSTSTDEDISPYLFDSKIYNERYSPIIISELDNAIKHLEMLKNNFLKSIIMTCIDSVKEAEPDAVLSQPDIDNMIELIQLACRQIRNADHVNDPCLGISVSLIVKTIDLYVCNLTNDNRNHLRTYNVPDDEHEYWNRNLFDL